MQDVPRLPDDAPLCGALREVAKETPTASQVAVVESEVRAVVRDLRATGVLPEQVIVHLRSTASDCGIHYGTTTDPFFARLVRWCVDEYFAEARSA